jgi:hypothetical protein
MMSQRQKRPSQKLRVSEILYSLNQGFEQVLADLRRLQQFPFFRREFLGEFRVMVEETRAWANFDVLETMHGRELDDWTRFGRLRHRWEKKYRDPDDVLIEADKLKRKRGRTTGTRLRSRKGADND